MGCNCGKKKQPQQPRPSGRQQSFQLELSNGQTFTFGSRLEAQAALIRSGRRGQIRSA